MFRSIIVRRSPIHGSGVFANRDLPAGATVVQYRGLLISHEEADRLHEGGIESGHTFLFTLNDEYVVDANRRGNSARWINHSCDPNCEAVIVEDAGGDPSRDRIFIETIRPVRRGEELTYDYGIKLHVRHTERLKRLWACRCGSPRCTGTMLNKKQRA
ncbi:MAG TPA: SET domain-containing protein-lysine N-methyltransferase [Nevskiaceae bacterium]|nr:SET domain-containing protein-lysine N-methyltransferase [Nevskiaceae bacterium]